MDSNQKRIKIAEACGWKNCGFGTSDEGEFCLMGCPPFPAGDVWGSRHYIPDFFNDLNACRSMEALIYDLPDKSAEWSDYLDYLTYLCSPVFQNTEQAVHASASQRSEAFGTILGLWKEGE